jgi:hypothetical protein
MRQKFDFKRKTKFQNAPFVFINYEYVVKKFAGKRHPDR